MAYDGRSMIDHGLVQDAREDRDADVLAEAAPGSQETVIEADVHWRQRRKVRAGLPFHDDLRSTWTTIHGGRA
jgi:hypothetical protein